MQLRTTNGYDFFEAASAMQKEIRRGKEENAMYWAIELSTKYPHFVWYRLATIASEDIGPAENSITILVDTLRRNYVEAAKKTKRPGERIILAHAVIALCRAPKSRIADDLCALVSHRIESEHERLDIPDYALDFHTQRGRKKGRVIDDAGWDHWVEQGCKLANEIAGLNIYKADALALRKKHGRLKPKIERNRRAAKKRDPGLFYPG